MGVDNGFSVVGGSIRDGHWDASVLVFGLGAPLLSKVTYGPAEVTKTIQPEVTVQHPEYQYRSVPVPVPYAAPYHTEPVVHHYPLPSTYSFDAVPALGFHGVPAVQYL